MFGFLKALHLGDSCTYIWSCAVISGEVIS